MKYYVVDPTEYNVFEFASKEKLEEWLNTPDLWQGTNPVDDGVSVIYGNKLELDCSFTVKDK